MKKMLLTGVLAFGVCLAQASPVQSCPAVLTVTVDTSGNLLSSVGALPHFTVEGPVTSIAANTPVSLPVYTATFFPQGRGFGPNEVECRYVVKNSAGTIVDWINMISDVPMSITDPATGAVYPSWNATGDAYVAAGSAASRAGFTVK